MIRRRLLGSLPLLLAAAILFVASTDVPFLRFLKTEFTYGWWVVVLIPAAAILLVSQLVIWVRWKGTRPWSRS